MKKLIYSFLAISLIWLLSACNQENKSLENKPITSVGSTNKDVWAEQLESNTSIMRPEGWADEDWKAVNKNVDQQKIFNTIADAVTSGNQKAYDFFTDSVFTVDQAKERLQNIKPENISAIRTRESWNFDKENFKLEKQVTRICLFTPKLGDNGEYMGDKALFYVKLNN